MNLLETRLNYHLTQIEAANIIGVPIRTYRRYEKNNIYGNKIKRSAFISKLVDTCEITENKGLLSIDLIKKELKKLFDSEYDGQISFCYLFGSYAKGEAKESSDVDLYISTNLSGLHFVGLIERVRNVLHKKIDLLRDSELENNVKLINEVLKNGIKIYG